MTPSRELVEAMTMWVARVGHGRGCRRLRRWEFACNCGCDALLEQLDIARAELAKEEA